MFGGFITANGTPGDGVLKFWWLILWVNAVNVALTAAFSFAIVAGAAIAWRRYG